MSGGRRKEGERREGDGKGGLEEEGGRMTGNSTYLKLPLAFHKRCVLKIV